MATYFLRPHAYVCSNTDGAILLDLRTDTYIGLDPSQVCALGTLVDHWPIPTLSGIRAEPRAAEEVRALADKLVQMDLLTRDPGDGKRASPVALAEVHTSLVDLDEMKRPTVRFGHVLRFIVAAFLTRATLRLRPLHVVMRRAEVRGRSRADRSCDAAKMRELTHVFLFLRTFFFSARNQCLFDSLTLVRFLAGYRVFPTLVFGVKVNPFGAHAWVQDGSSVLNGRPEYVRRFSPIIAV